MMSALLFSGDGGEGEPSAATRAVRDLWHDLGHIPSAGDAYALMKLREQLEDESIIDKLMF